MTDIPNEFSAVHREIGDYPVATGAGRSLLLRRPYDASVQDVWHACTTPERLGRWLAPVTGDLAPGGTFRVEGQASGRILVCQEPHLLKVTWEYGPDSVTEVELRLAEDADGGTVLELRHTSPTETVDEIVRRMGPIGPIGMGGGWDLALLGLGRLFRKRDFDTTQWQETPEARELAIRSYHAWGAASQPVWGLSDDEIAKVVDFAVQQFTPGSQNSPTDH